MAANVFLTPEVISKVAIAALTHQIVLPRTVNRTAEAEFGGGQGTVVNIKTPPTVTGGGVRTYTQTLRDASTPIVLDRLSQTTIPLTMGPELYKGVPITDDDATFEISDYQTQVIDPIVQVVGLGAEAVLVDVMNGIDADTDIVPDIDGSDLHDALIEARMKLNKADVPPNGRRLAISPELEAVLLKDPQNRLVRYDASGSSDALRQANIGRLYGMEVYVSNQLEANSALIYQTDAFAYALRAPVVPKGCTWGQSVAYQGIAMRIIRDYDPSFLQDRIIAATFAAAEVLDDRLSIRLVAA